MPFSQEQRARLEAPLDPGLIHTRKKQGVELVYLEGFEAINQANAIFGYDGWSYVVTRLEQVGTIWYATVRVTVNAGGDHIEREDVGVGLPAAKAGETPSPDAVETAIKSSLTDALKRALRTWGSAFGNDLYSKDGDDAKGAAPQPHAAPATRATPIGPERAAKLEGLVQKALTDQGATVAYALNWLDAAQRRLGKAHMSDLTAAEGQALLDRAARADVTQPPDAPASAPADGSWESTASPAREPDADNGETQPCPTCGSPMVLRSGEKNGRQWHGWFCSDRSCAQKPVFLADRGTR